MEHTGRVQIERVAAENVRVPDTVESDRGYADLYTLHERRVFRLAALLCGDAHLAEEITADVFAQVLPKWRRGAVTDVLPYLRRTTVNEVRSRFRRRGRERRALVRLRVDAAHGEPTHLELREPLIVALRTLPVRQRAVVVLRYYEDLPEAEVATTLGIAVGTVKSHASQALARLRVLMQEDER